ARKKSRLRESLFAEIASLTFAVHNRVQAMTCRPCLVQESRQLRDMALVRLIRGGLRMTTGTQPLYDRHDLRCKVHSRRKSGEFWRRSHKPRLIDGCRLSDGIRDFQRGLDQ